MSARPMENANRRVGLIAAFFAVAMVGLAYAAVPLYRMFCEATGFGGTPQVAAAAPLRTGVVGRPIKIRFDANTAPGLDWRFRPKANEVSIPIGEKRLGFYEARNLGSTPITGRAVYNVSPDVVGRYFIKIDCFCFTEQTLQPGETVDMPVSYYIDPAIMDDPVASKVDEITLSYTFYTVDNPSPATLDGAAKRITSR